MGAFRIKRANPHLIVSYWCHLIENLQASPQDFYRRLEQAIVERRIPQLEGGAVEWPEGGPFSAKRQYLRLLRERTVIDICAAPFGTGFFVSWRLGEVPLRLRYLALLLIFAAAVAVVIAMNDYFHTRFHRSPLIP